MCIRDSSKIDVKDGLTLIGDTSNDFQYEEEEIEDEEIDLTYSNEISSDTYDIIKSQCEIYLMLHEETNYDVTYKLKKGLGILYEMCIRDRYQGLGKYNII